MSAIGGKADMTFCGANVVFTQVADPVGQRLIDSLAHPGGNATGLTNFEFGFGAKWVELLAEFDPAISHVTLITNPANENTAQFVKVITAAGATKNLAVRVSSVRDVADIQDAIENSSKKPGGGLIIFPDGLLINHRALIVELAARYRLPAVYPFRVFPEVGGLLSCRRWPSTWCGQRPADRCHPEVKIIPSGRVVTGKQTFSTFMYRKPKPDGPPPR
jgi:ABC-type uncharacterized transport system substrate-binding protein